MCPMYCWKTKPTVKKHLWLRTALWPWFPGSSVGDSLAITDFSSVFFFLNFFQINSLVLRRLVTKTFSSPKTTTAGQNKIRHSVILQIGLNFQFIHFSLFIFIQCFKTNSLVPFIKSIYLFAWTCPARR